MGVDTGKHRELRDPTPTSPVSNTQMATTIARRGTAASEVRDQGREPSIDIEVEAVGTPVANRDKGAVGAFGRYELLGRLAVGGMAEIYLGREVVDDQVERYVVLKLLKPDIAQDEDFVLLFRDEARLAAQLQHPHIAHVYEYGQVSGRHYMAMEWIHGVPLSSHLKRLRKRGQQVPVAVALRIVSDIAEALDHAHAARGVDGRPLGIVHRDVSPQNIMISYDGAVKLVDFGVAKAERRLSTTQAGVVRGKFAYMSPEQCVGTADIDGRSDIFSLGIVLHELLTGELLFERPSDFETMRAVAEQRIPPPLEKRPSMPSALSDVVMRALERRVGRRYLRAREFQEALQRYWVSQGEVVSTGRIADHIQLVWADEIQGGISLARTAFLDGLPPPRRALTPTPILRDPTGKVPTPVTDVERENRRFAFGPSELVSVLLLAALIAWIVWPSGSSPGPKAVTDAPAGVLNLVSDPPGATVTLGDDVLGVTPLEAEGLPLGEQMLEFQLDGYEPTSIEVEVGTEPLQVSSTLEPAEPETSEPAGSDGETEAPTPEAETDPAETAAPEAAAPAAAAPEAAAPEAAAPEADSPETDN
ncbi:MAG: serine/threonine-protein kinase [Myxococcota bacterium]